MAQNRDDETELEPEPGDLADYVRRLVQYAEDVETEAEQDMRLIPHAAPWETEARERDER